MLRGSARDELRGGPWLMRWCARLAAVSVVLHVAAARGGAQVAPAAESAEYRAAIDEAVSDFAARRFEESRSMFARAHALFPNARTLRGIGIADFELRSYDECVRRLSEALRSEVRPLDAELRADTEAVLARALRYVGRYKIRSQPATSELFVDGVATPLRDGEPLLLRSGDHVLTLQAAGYAPKQLQIRAFGGEEETLEVQFERPAATATPAVPLHSQAARAGTSSAWYESPWLWVAVGVVIAGAGTGLAVTLSQEAKPAAVGGTSGIVIQGIQLR